MQPSYTSCVEHARSQEDPHNSPNVLPLTAELPSDTAVPGDSPFLRLPTEIRLQIYQLLVLPTRHNDLLPSYDKVSKSAQDYFDYDQLIPNTTLPASADLQRPTLRFRTINPLQYHAREGTVHHDRSKFSVRCDRFSARCLETTYHCLNNPNLNLAVGLMRANKQIHAEIAELLYGHFTFDFDNHVEAIVPFMQDLTPFSRSCIKSVRVVKRSLAYEKEFDKCEWANAMQCLGSAETGLSLQNLELGIVAGRPGPNGWDMIPAYGAGEFGVLKDMEGMEWLRDLLELRGLRTLSVTPIVEHCPPASSSRAMAGYIRFSASIEEGLSRFLEGEMLV